MHVCETVLYNLHTEGASSSLAPLGNIPKELMAVHQNKIEAKHRYIQVSAMPDMIVK